MNKADFNKFIDNWIREIRSSSPEQIKHLQNDLNNMPSDSRYCLPEWLDLEFPDKHEITIQKYVIAVNAHYHYSMDTKFMDSSVTSYQPNDFTSVNKVRQALDYKPAA